MDISILKAIAWVLAILIITPGTMAILYSSYLFIRCFGEIIKMPSEKASKEIFGLIGPIIMYIIIIFIIALTITLVLNVTK